MDIVFFTHPPFLGLESMQRYTSMLSEGMKKKGYNVKIWYPKPRLSKIPSPAFVKKWLGYADQYILFRFDVIWRMKKCYDGTLFVFTDHALGPWVPWIGKRPQVIHCHDFLAQRSALGNIIENPTKWFGRQYQAFIRRGYRHGKNYISVSKKTKEDLHYFLLKSPQVSEVVYNGLNQSFSNTEPNVARSLLAKQIQVNLQEGYILHIGGNQWYKNRVGVIKIYNEFKRSTGSELPLLLIGKSPSPELEHVYQNSAFKSDIYFLTHIGDELLKIAYAGASVFLFPSLDEGFGWPIAEAMASGCPVITTNTAPMTEVGGNAALYIPRMPADKNLIEQWAQEAGNLVNKVIRYTIGERAEIVKSGLVNSERFNTDVALTQIENIYKQCLK
jgi:glycosyltransferase involved in cell wall biosynthesis